MFFLLSKTAGLLADPLYLSLLLLVAAGLLRLIKRLPRLQRRSWQAALVLLLLCSSGAVASLLLHPLEARHPRGVIGARPAALVMLAGAVDDQRPGPSYYELTEAADRFVELMRLARRYPNAAVVIAGGSGSLDQRRPREAQTLGRLARELGLPPARLLLDRESRNTRENAVETRRLLRAARVEGKGQVVLITSAYHMPRAVACFARVGLEVVPWPVDFLGTGYSPGTWLPRPWSLDRSRSAIREYLGWLAYSIAGYV